jgi:predicted RNA polymerase sigma factor
MASETHRAIDAVWRIEAPQLIAGLTRIVRDVGLAEELAQDALVVALEKRWRRSSSGDVRDGHGHPPVGRRRRLVRDGTRRRTAAPSAGRARITNQGQVLARDPSANVVLRCSFTLSGARSSHS